MNNSLDNYIWVCRKANRKADALEYMAWSYLGVVPDWCTNIVEGE